MANLRTTVILKTDIVDSTPILAEQTPAEMGLQRRQHKSFIAKIAAQHQGSVFQEEGDAYWIAFPSVTNAALAALAMHQELRSMQAGKSDQKRLAIRIVITVGDLLHQESDLIGTAMNLTARIEKVTPPDEIYLSHAAWLLLNKAEVQTSFVNEFNLKGFSEPEKVYRVDQKHGIRVVADQYIILADAKGFGSFSRQNSMETIENFLLEYDGLMNDICTKHNGVIRQVNGDQYFLTFLEADQLAAALETFCREWEGILERYKVGIYIGVHKGSIHVFHSYVFGTDINITGYLSKLGRPYKSQANQVCAITSTRVRDELQGTEWEKSFRSVDIDKIDDEEFKTIAREHGAFEFIVDGKS